MSTRTALTVVGAVVGAYFGYPQLGFALGALVGSAVDPEQIQGPRIGEVNAQTSIEGAPRTIIYGTYPCFGNVIQTGQVIKVDVEESQGKGGPEVSNEHAYRTYAIRICEGPIGGILRVWEDNKLVYDVRPGSAMLIESAAWEANKVFYLGGEDQLPDPTLVSTVNEDTPAYRGSAYMVAILQDLTDRRGSIPQYRYEVAASTTSADVAGPLVVGPWTDEGRPLHSTGDTTYIVDGDPEPDYESAVAAAIAEAVVHTPAAGESNQFVAFTTSFNDLPSGFTGGASAGQAEEVTYHLAHEIPDVWEDPTIPPSGEKFCTALFGMGARVGDGLVYAVWEGTPFPSMNIVRLTPFETLLPDDPWAGPKSYCTMYPPAGGNYPNAQSNPVVKLVAKRKPSPPPGWSRVTGTAKQLAAVEYRSGVLYQNGLGPVLLPGDPNYSNATFWADQKSAAVAAGLMEADVTSPAIVSEYAAGHDTVAGVPVALGDIVADIHERCGSDASTYDVSELTDLVAGLGLAGDYTGASAIEVCRPIYNFDKSLHDGKFWYPQRGGAVVETLTVDDLTEIPDTTKREQALDVPRKFHLRYQHAASGYAPVQATSPRTPSPDFLTTGEASYEIPVVLNEDQGAQCSDRMYKIMRAEQAGQTEVTVPLDVGAKYAEGNCIGLLLRGRVTRQRIEQMDFADWKIKLTLKPDRQSAYTSNLTGVPIPEPTLPPSTIVGETELAVMDLPARVDSEDSLGIVIAVDGALPPWKGARYQRSIDGGASYSTVADMTTASVMGVLLDPVTDASEHVTDYTNVLRVQLYRSTHSLESISNASFMNEGGGLALEKDDGSWEIVQCRDWVDEGGQIFAGTVLHRGLLNTGTSEHMAGSRFVMLQRPAFIAMQSAWIGQGVTHRAISLGGVADDTNNEITQVYAGRSQIEWPVAHLTLSRNGTDISATWAPRHRFGTDLSPVASINFQGFRVTLDDGVLPVVTFDTTMNSISDYDASALGSPLTVSVQAINRITGAGPATSGTV